MTGKGKILAQKITRGTLGLASFLRFYMIKLWAHREPLSLHTLKQLRKPSVWTLKSHPTLNLQPKSILVLRKTVLGCPMDFCHVVSATARAFPGSCTHEVSSLTVQQALFALLPYLFQILLLLLASMSP